MQNNSDSNVISCQFCWILFISFKESSALPAAHPCGGYTRCRREVSVSLLGKDGIGISMEDLEKRGAAKMEKGEEKKRKYILRVEGLDEGKRKNRYVVSSALYFWTPS